MAIKHVYTADGGQLAWIEDIALKLVEFKEGTVRVEVMVQTAQRLKPVETAQLADSIVVMMRPAIEKFCASVFEAAMLDGGRVDIDMGWYTEDASN